MLERSINRLINKGMYEVYDKEFMEYVRSGNAVEINDRSGYFIPHMAVLRPNAVSTKLVRNDDNVAMKFHNSDNAQLILKGLDTIPSIIYQRKSDKPAIKYVVMGLAPDKLVCN